MPTKTLASIRADLITVAAASLPEAFQKRAAWLASEISQLETDAAVASSPYIVIDGVDHYRKPDAIAAVERAMSANIDRAFTVNPDTWDTWVSKGYPGLDKGVLYHAGGKGRPGYVYPVTAIDEFIVYLKTHYATERVGTVKKQRRRRRMAFKGERPE